MCPQVLPGKAGSTPGHKLCHLSFSSLESSIILYTASPNGTIFLQPLFHPLRALTVSASSACSPCTQQPCKCSGCQHFQLPCTMPQLHAWAQIHGSNSYSRKPQVLISPGPHCKSWSPQQRGENRPQADPFHDLVMGVGGWISLVAHRLREP